MLVLAAASMLCAATPAHAHGIHYRVENTGISVRVFYAPDEPASYAGFEIFGPHDKLPHQKGRTDKNGFVAFLPDRKGTWIVKVSDETEHGVHAARIEVQVNEGLYMESFRKPLVARHIPAFVGLSFFLAAFGLWSLIERRRHRYPGEKNDAGTSDE